MALPNISNTQGGGTFNLNKFKAEVQARLSCARELSGDLTSSKYMRDLSREDAVSRSSSIGNVRRSVSSMDTTGRSEAAENAYARVQKVSSELREDEWAWTSGDVRSRRSQSRSVQVHAFESLRFGS